MDLRSQVTNLFSFVDDPRVQGRVKHELKDILFIALCTVLANGEDYEDMVEFARQREAWLRQIIDLDNGIPSHDTFNRVFQLIDPEQFSQCLGEDARLLIGQFKDQLIQFDGKKLRGHDPTSRGNAGLYLLNAWVSEHQLCIGQVEVGKKTNEIKAIPELIERLDLTGATVSIDAIGCQADIAQQLIKKEADYILSVKGNQKALLEQCQESFKIHQHQTHEISWSYDHGRYETRRAFIVSASGMFSPELADKWVGAGTIIRLESERTLNGVTSCETRYYISSHTTKTPEWFNTAIRAHWSIENQLHWHLDVSFAEDASRARRGFAAQNLSILRKLAINRIKQMQTKLSLKKRRFRASLNFDYLLEVLLLDF